MDRVYSSPILCRGLVLAAVLTLSLCAVAADDLDQQMPSSLPVTPTVVAPSPPLIPLKGSSAADLEHQGDLLRAQKRYLDAVDYYQAALEQQETPLRYNKLGMAYLFLQQESHAKKAFNHALKLDKNCAEAWNNRGFVEQVSRNYGRAAKYYEHALALKPESPTFHYNLASVYFARHKYQEAATGISCGVHDRSRHLRSRVAYGHPGADQFAGRSRRVFLYGRQDVCPGGGCRSLAGVSAQSDGGRLQDIKRVYTDRNSPRCGPTSASPS